VRTSRPKTPVIYPSDERFEVGKCKVLRHTDQDRVTVVAAGVTVYEALKAHAELAGLGIPVRVIDLFSVQPVDRETLAEAARVTGGLIVTVEDRYRHGGIGDVVLGALGTERVEIHKLAVGEIPRSGGPEELLEKYGISARAIVEKVKSLIG